MDGPCINGTKLKKLGNHTAYHALDDQQLLEQYRIFGKRECLGILLERYTLLLLGVCMKYLRNEEAARDAVQQVFTKAIAEVNKYPVNYVKSWLYTIARNYCLMQLRQRHREVAFDEVPEKPESFQPPEPAWNAAMQQEQVYTLLQQGLDRLPEGQRQCLSMFYLHRQSYRQISEQTGLTLMQVKSHIQNGKRSVRLWMDKQMKQHAS